MILLYQVIVEDLFHNGRVGSRGRKPPGRVTHPGQKSWSGSIWRNVPCRTCHHVIKHRDGRLFSRACLMTNH